MIMIVNQLSSNRRLRPRRYALGMTYFLMIALHQPLFIKAERSQMSLVESTHTRNLSNIQPESNTPSTSPTNYDDRSCTNRKTELDRLLCHGFTISQVKSTIITFKITAALSILGSSYVVQDVLCDPKKRNESTYHRIMLGLSCSDILFSFFGPFLGPWVMPRGIQLSAVGSNATCSVVGFFVGPSSFVALLYSCSLATFYLIKLKYSWVNSKVKAIEKWLLFLPCAMGLIAAIPAVARLKFGPHGLVCT